MSLEAAGRDAVAEAKVALVGGRFGAGQRRRGAVGAAAAPYGHIPKGQT